MDKIIQDLKNTGCDIDTTLKRFLDDKEFMIQCMKKAVVDEDFDKIGGAIAYKDAKEVFELAHGLKGVLLNVGLDKLYEKVSVIVEELRAGEWSDKVLDEYDELLRCKKKYYDILNG